MNASVHIERDASRLDTGSDGVPALDIAFEPERITYEQADAAFNEARSSGKEITKIQQKLAKLEKHAEFDSLQISLIDENGIGEIRLSKTSKSVRITFKTDPAPEGLEKIKKWETLFNEEAPGFGKSNINFSGGNSIFRDSRALAVLTAVCTESEVIGITGKNVTWRIPPEPKNGSDPFAAVRELHAVTLGFDANAVNFAFRNVTFIDPVLGDHQGKDFFKDCTLTQSADESDADTTVQSAESLPETQDEPKDNPIENSAEPQPERETPEPGDSNKAGAVVSPDAAELKSAPMLSDSLASAVGISAEVIQQKKAEIPNDHVLEIIPATNDIVWQGAISAAKLIVSPDGAATIQLRFAGNNLPAPIADTAGNSLLEFSFSTAGMDENKIIDLQQALELAVSKQTADTSAFEAGVSILEHEAVAAILDVIREHTGSGSVSHLFMQNTFFDAENAGKTDSGIVFSETVLGSHSILEPALGADGVTEQSAIQNCIIQNSCFAALTGKFSNTVLENLDLRSGQIAADFDSSSRIEKLSAIGATVSGKIDCPISGDFRSARLGTAAAPLTGAAFETINDVLSTDAFQKMHHFVIDKNIAGDELTLLLNERPISLSAVAEQVEVTTVASIKEDTSNYNIFDRIRDRSMFSQVLEKTASLTFEDAENLAVTNDWKYCARIEPSGGDPSEPEFRVRVNVWTLPESMDKDITAYQEAVPAFKTESQTAESAVYILKQLALFDAELTLLSHAAPLEAFRQLEPAVSNAAVQAAVSAYSQAQSGHSFFDETEEIIALNGRAPK